MSERELRVEYGLSQDEFAELLKYAEEKERKEQKPDLFMHLRPFRVGGVGGRDGAFWGARARRAPFPPGHRC